ncbi:MAG: tetratricopeptide repeat protein, partial [candidate division WOR-3 bacterium]
MIKKSPLINTVRRKSLVVYALNERANVFQLLGNYEEAEKDYYRMLKILPTTQNRLLFYAGLSDLCLEAGKIEDAYNSIQKALYLSRKNKLILEHIKGLLSFSH